MNQIAELRTQNNVTLETLAHNLGISVTTLNQYETGIRIPDSLTIVKVADFFGASINSVLGYPELPTTAVPAITETTRVTTEYETNKVNIYLALGWKLLHVATETTPYDGGTQDARICYVLGWHGVASEAPTPSLAHPQNREKTYY